MQKIITVNAHEILPQDSFSDWLFTIKDGVTLAEVAGAVRKHTGCDFYAVDWAELTNNDPATWCKFRAEFPGGSEMVEFQMVWQ